MAKHIDGKAIAEEIRGELRQTISAMKQRGIEGTLAVIQVGCDPASSVYVANKKKACEALGIHSESCEFPEDVTEALLLKKIQEYNHNPRIDGILVQLPLPSHIDEKKVIAAIDPTKDVDGFHPMNVGALLIGEKGIISCTPAGVIELLKRSGIPIAGKHCVVVGRSNIVGKPMAVLMLRENATVTIAHSRTKDLESLCRTADILIVAVGKPKMIKASFIKEGAVVIDVGIHRMENKKLCGDVDFSEVEPLASAITPVPGGVGPMTIAMLMNNVVCAMKEHYGL